MATKHVEETRRMAYKRVKMTVEHCPVCGEMLHGNGSIVLPWWCSCGIWKVKNPLQSLPFEYVVTPTPE